MRNDILSTHPKPVPTLLTDKTLLRAILARSKWILSNMRHKSGTIYAITLFLFGSLFLNSPSFALNDEVLPPEQIFSEEVKAEWKDLKIIIHSIDDFYHTTLSNEEYYLKGVTFEKVISEQTMPTHIKLNYLIWNSSIKYYFLSVLPNNEMCEKAAFYPWAPEGNPIERIACTIGEKTWIRTDLVQKMTARQIALLLIHESLRRSNLAYSDILIYKITTGLSIALD
ncbi:MAG: hypothetical protein ABL927_11100, partial [Bdellovibrionales bacterium]